MRLRSLCIIQDRLSDYSYRHNLAIGVLTRLTKLNGHQKYGIGLATLNLEYFVVAYSTLHIPVMGFTCLALARRRC